MVFILDEPRTVRPGLSVKQEGPILPNVNCLPFLGHEKWEVFLCASISG